MNRRLADLGERLASELIVCGACGSMRSRHLPECFCGSSKSQPLTECEVIVLSKFERSDPPAQLALDLERVA